MNKKEIIRAQVGAILNEPEVIGKVVVPYDRRFDRMLVWLGLKSERIEELTITGATAATNYKITTLIQDLITESDQRGSDGKMWHIINSNILLIVDILAIAIHNAPGNPPAWLTHALSHNFSQEQLKEIMAIVYRRLDVDSFFGTLGLVRNLNPESDIQETTPFIPSLEE